MPSLIDSKTLVAIGQAAHSDPFQGGREAAQMALNQLSNATPTLALVFGSRNATFSAFLEGVRLVIGETRLIGIPTSWSVHDGLSTTETSFVFLIHAPHHHVALTSTSLTQKNVTADSTALISQLRNQSLLTGENHLSYRTLLLFHNLPLSETATSMQTIAADYGLDGLIVAMGAHIHDAKPLICQDKFINQGLVAVDYTSNAPFGLGYVALNEFKDEKNTLLEAIKTALRAARAQMKESAPAFALVFINHTTASLPSIDTQQHLHEYQQIMGNIPIIFLATTHQYARETLGCFSSHNAFVSVLAGPQ